MYANHGVISKSCIKMHNILAKLSEYTVVTRRISILIALIYSLIFYKKIHPHFIGISINNTKYHHFYHKRFLNIYDNIFRT